MTEDVKSEGHTPAQIIASGLDLEIAQYQSPWLEIHKSRDGKSEPLVSIDLTTGDLTYGPNYTPDAAAKVFWESIQNIGRALVSPSAVNEREALLRCEAALRPFAEAWAVANRHKTPMTLAEFGALAMHHCSSVDFRKAHVALTLLDEARK